MQSTEKITHSRQLVFSILREIERRDAYTDIALDRALKQTSLITSDRALVTQLVYGIVRRKRTLDTLIDQLGKKSSSQQSRDLRIILYIGLYQLRYLTQIPPSAAVNTAVELAKENRLKKLSGVVNGILRQYIRLTQNKIEPLILPDNPITKLGILSSFPDFMIEMWLEKWGLETTKQLCDWFNQPPLLDIRINTLKSTLEEVEAKLTEANINVVRLKNLPQALRLTGKIGAIQQLPGFKEGWWTVQDSSAQLVGHLLDPQPSEVIIDACAAPGGKTTHIAELMGDQGLIWACDRVPSRLKKLKANAQRLQLKSLQILEGDILELDQFREIADRVLVDAPCSGLGTLHRHPDLRWRQTPDKIEELGILQQQLLDKAASWVKSKGILVYSTCTLTFRENEAVIQQFLASHPHWKIEPPSSNSPTFHWVTASGWIEILPHQQQMDGFFMVKLKKG
ncbi:MAG TPA: 16S rRNA (cytosine(967)-C(5))-methyltransferase [Cyanothece sp. UBA12306]|nr:16S rRNA (cytosine(967)-C(5))-methyltransferase [Cyanothece sp. UBA12306]